MKELLKEMLSEIRKLYRMYFALTEVLVQKGVLNDKDVEYMRNESDKDEERKEDGFKQV